MTLNVYCYYNKLLEAFGNFQLDDHEPKKVVAGLSRDLRARFLKGDSTKELEYLDLYVLGTFDDETGVFKNDKHLLLDLGNVVSQLKAQQEALKKAEAEKKKGD